MRSLTPSSFTLRRLADDWKLLLSVFLGVVIAISLVAGTPIYLKTLERLGLDTTIDGSSSLSLSIVTTAEDVQLGREELRRVEESVEEIVQRSMSSVYKERQLYIRTDQFLLNPTPIIPRPKIAAAIDAQPEDAQAESGGMLGYFINMHELEDYVTIVQGNMAGDAVTSDLSKYAVFGPVAEAVVGAELARRYDVHLGDLVTLLGTVRNQKKASARVVGIVEPTDAGDEYWQGRAGVFFDPPPVTDVPKFQLEVDTERPPIAFIVTPEAASKLPGELVEPSGYNFSGAFLVTASNLADHVTFPQGQGRMAGDVVLSGPRGPEVEAILGMPLGRRYGLSLGDVVTLTPFIDESTWVSARIVGMAERTDPSDDYWQWSPNSLFVSRGMETPLLQLIITREAMVEGLGRAYPGILASSVWLTRLDKEGLKEWTIAETRRRLSDLKTDLAKALPGHLTFSGVSTLLDVFERKNFFTRVPLLLLLTTMVATVLYFLSMMVSYLVQSRETDVAALRTRGSNTRQLLRLYGLEGLVMSAVALALAPFIALGVTAAAGTLPYFRLLTRGDLLPVELRLFPFLVAAGAGLLCLSILLIPTVSGTRGGMLMQRFRSSRPPSIPLIHRYHLDTGLMVLGGLIFWEAHSRGQLVVGGLFKDIQVNETLLLAPILYLTVVALLFIRLFPLALRFFNGESPAIMHLGVAATVVVLGLATLAREARESSGLAWVAPVVLLLALAATYWATHRARRTGSRYKGMALQVAIVALFVVLEPPDADDISFVPTLVLISIVPAQLIFILFKAFARLAPVWVSLALWHMARNPLQYTWLVLLLVLGTGLAAFSTTVGATLENRDRDSILYDVAADLRASGIQGVTDVEEKYLALPGVMSVSSAFRGEMKTLLSFGRPFEVLAVQSSEFAEISWYREDFSVRPLQDVMRVLRPAGPVGPAVIPADATALGMWAKLTSFSPSVFLELVLQDGRGALTVLDLGKLISHEWVRMEAEIPVGLAPPVHLVAVRVLPALGLIGVAGAVLFDDIHATVGMDGQEYVLDGFERDGGWTPLPTSMVAAESAFEVDTDAHRGDSSGRYSYGEGAERGPPGIYVSPNGGPLPVVAGSLLIESGAIGAGDTFISEISGKLVPMTVLDTVEYFPTMNPRSGGFVIADLDLFLAHLAILEAGSAPSPNEFFIAAAPTAGEELHEELRRLTPWPGQVRDGRLLIESLAESVRLNPLVTAGWKAMALLSLGIVVLTTAIGYVTYLLFFANRGRIEMDLVRAMGLSQRQVTGLLVLEHLVIVLVGMGLGVWAGLQMSYLTIPLVALTETGESAVPPILVATDWRVISTVCAALAATFAIMLFVLRQRIFQSQLHSISKAEV